MDDYIKVNQVAYDKLVSHYRKRRDSKSSFEEKPELLASSITRHIVSTQKKLNFLEIGPGSGEILRFFENAGYKTTAIDISINIIDLAKEIAPNTKFIHSNILEVKLPKNSFDIIYAGAIVHLFSKDDAIILIKKIWKWLSPNGLLFINTTISKKSEEGFLIKEDSEEKIIRYRKKWIKEEFILTLQSNNFEIKDIIYTDEKDRNKKWIGLICLKIQLSMKKGDNKYLDKELFTGETFNIVKRSVEINNASIEFEVIKRPKIVLIIPFISSTEIVFIEQFRSTINNVLMELPAGKVDKDESSKQAAKRELLEETGYLAKKLEKIGEFYSAPHIMDEMVEVFIATDLDKYEKKLQPKEFISNKILTTSSIEKNMWKLNYVDSKTITALSLFFNKVNH